MYYVFNVFDKGLCILNHIWTHITKTIIATKTTLSLISIYLIPFKSNLNISNIDYNQQYIVIKFIILLFRLT